MDLAHAIATGALAARMTGHRFTASDAEVREAEQRVLARRAEAAVASGRRVYTERGRHAAPRPARA